MVEIYFDIDGCLIDAKYKYNMKMATFRDKIVEAKEKGFIFNLNSNRSLDSILAIRGVVGFDGVVITESGITSYNTQKNTNTTIESFSEFPWDKIKSDLEVVGYDVILGTDKSLIRNPNKFKDKCSEANESIFFQNKRKYTATLYPLKLDNDQVVVGDIETVKDVLEENYGGLYDIISGSKYGNLILTPKGSNKGLFLDDNINNNIAFGDAIVDIDMFKKSHFFGCPANAQEEVKTYVRNNGGYVCKEEFTKGAYEFLDHLLH